MESVNRSPDRRQRLAATPNTLHGIRRSDPLAAERRMEWRALASIARSCGDEGTRPRAHCTAARIFGSISGVTTAARAGRWMFPRRPFRSMSSISSLISRISRTCPAMISSASWRTRGSRRSDGVMRDHRLHEPRIVDEALRAIHAEQDDAERRRDDDDGGLEARSFVHRPHEAEHDYRHHRAHDEGRNEAVQTEHEVVSLVDELVHQEEHDDHRRDDHGGETPVRAVHHRWSAPRLRRRRSVGAVRDGRIRALRFSRHYVLLSRVWTTGQ